MKHTEWIASGIYVCEKTEEGEPGTLLATCSFGLTRSEAELRAKLIVDLHNKLQESMEDKTVCYFCKEPATGDDWRTIDGETKKIRTCNECTKIPTETLLKS